MKLLLSPYLWFAVLAVMGAIVFAAGVTVQFGQGYGLMVFGALCLLGSEAIRNGLRRG